MDTNINTRYKSYAKMLRICLNASLSAFFVGYSLVYVGVLTDQDFKMAIQQDYGFSSITSDLSLVKSLVNGSVPVGAIFGALLSSLVINNLSRRNGFLATNALAVLSTLVLGYVRNPYVFLSMRIMQGICTGIYSAIVPLYINEIVTPEIANLGSLNQISIAFAQFFCALLSIVCSAALGEDRPSTIWRIIAEFPLLTIVIQSLVFLFVYPFETAKYLYEQGRREEAASLMNTLYTERHINDTQDIYTSGSSVFEDNTIAVKTAMVGVPEAKPTNSKTAVFFAIYIALLQQMSGVNAIAVYGKQTLEQALKGKDAAIAAATLSQYAASVVASFITIKLMNTRGRKFLIQLGTLVCTICLGVCSGAFLLKGDKGFSDSVWQGVVIIVSNVVFMAFFGLTLGPIVWLYIPEIVEPNIIPYSTMTNLIGATLCIIAFPIVIGDNAARTFIPFVFFFAFCLVSLFVNQKLMVETKDKSKEKICEEYQAKKIC